MSRRNPNAKALIDEYIARLAILTQLICRSLRAIILKADPEIVEDWKWGPNYSKDGMVCGFGAFQHHVSLAFFRGASMKDPQKLFIQEKVAAKTMRRIKFTSVDEVDEKTVTAYVREAIKINVRGLRPAERALVLPKDFRMILSKEKAARRFFESLSYTNRKEYVRWIETAKMQETRTARLKKAGEMLAKNIKHP